MPSTRRTSNRGLRRPACGRSRPRFSVNSTLRAVEVDGCRPVHAERHGVRQLDGLVSRSSCRFAAASACTEASTACRGHELVRVARRPRLTAPTAAPLSAGAASGQRRNRRPRIHTRSDRIVPDMCIIEEFPLGAGLGQTNGARPEGRPLWKLLVGRLEVHVSHAAAGHDRRAYRRRLPSRACRPRPLRW